MKMYLGTLVPRWYLVGTSAGIIYMGFRILKDPNMGSQNRGEPKPYKAALIYMIYKYLVTRMRPTRGIRSRQPYKLFSMEYDTKGMKGRLSCHWYRIIMRGQVFVNHALGIILNSLILPVKFLLF